MKKKYLKVIIVLAGMLMFFPFIGLPEFWEYLYVVLPSAGIAFLGVELLKIHAGNQEKKPTAKDVDTGYIDDRHDVESESETLHEDY